MADLAQLSKDRTKQFGKVVNVAKSVGGLVGMIEAQCLKASTSKDDDVASKAVIAVEKAKISLAKEVKVLLSDCTKLDAMDSAIIKALKKK